jgi:hypothetical protein
MLRQAKTEMKIWGEQNVCHRTVISVASTLAIHHSMRRQTLPVDASSLLYSFNIIIKLLSSTVSKLHKMFMSQRNSV